MNYYNTIDVCIPAV